MTREEKVNLLNELLEIEEKNDIGNLTSMDRREFQQWVEDLEQEPILGKIRAEITAISITGQVDEHTMFVRTGEQVKQMALDVIDKYNADFEPQESEERK